jgi:hypothetical protein
MGRYQWLVLMESAFACLGRSTRDLRLRVKRWLDFILDRYLQESRSELGRLDFVGQFWRGIGFFDHWSHPVEPIAVCGFASKLFSQLTTSNTSAHTAFKQRHLDIC